MIIWMFFLADIPFYKNIPKNFLDQYSRSTNGMKFSGQIGREGIRRLGCENEGMMRFG